MGWCLLYPRTMKQSNLPLNNPKPFKSPPRVVFDGGFATVNMAFVLKILVSPLKHYAFTVVELTLV